MPGGSTVIIKSEGAMAANQPDVLGVYRMVDSFDNRPVYKQDGGENYIYYRCLDWINRPISQKKPLAQYQLSPALPPEPGLLGQLWATGTAG